MELRHLRYFIAVAEEGSITRAAPRLHMAQPPLGQQIATLENELGVKLFERIARGVRLTHAGRLFLEEARRTVAQAQHAAETAQRAARGQLGQLGVGFITSATNVFLSRIIRRFRAHRPDISLSLHDKNEQELLRSLQQGSLDVILMRHVAAGDDLATLELWQDTLNVALPVDHPLALEPKVSLESLAHQPFVLLNPEFSPRATNCLVALCQTHGFIPQVTQYANDYQSLIWLVSVGLGVTIVTESLRDLQREGMVWRPLAVKTGEARMQMIWRRDNRSPVLETFVQVVKTELGLEADSPLPLAINRKPVNRHAKEKKPKHK